MKLIESEFDHESDERPERATPPRPEHRRVYTSLFVTMSVLIGIVVTVYLVFPKRDNELLDAAIEAHFEDAPLELVTSNAVELEAWTLGVLGRAVPWPKIDGAVRGARSLAVLRRNVVLARYQIGDDRVSVLATRARSTPPRTRRRTRNGTYCVSWHSGKWTLVAVGPATSAKQWSEPVGAP